MEGVFDGVRIIELATHVFVPSAAAVLSDLGADVVKVEHPRTGDPYRSLHTAALGRDGRAVNIKVEHANRGKRSIGLDIKHPAGRELLLRLVAGADVFLTNLRPRALRSAGLDVAAVRAVNPAIIYARGHGFGARGPGADRAGYDASAYWARGGVGLALTPEDAPEVIAQRPAFGDNQGAMNLAFGVAAALFKRGRTGAGSVVDVSLLGTAMWTLAFDVLSAFNPGYVPRTAGRPSGWNPLTSTFRTKDGRFITFVLLEPDRYWSSFCEHIGRPELIDDPGFVDMPARADNADSLLEILEAVFAASTYDEWRARLATFDGPWEPFQHVRELYEDEQVVANDYLINVEEEDFQLVAPPAQFDETPVRSRRAPEHGEHTEQVLLELGLSWDEIAGYKSRGAIM
ncbi:MAG TPA: CoA transferase [Acidimicrobiales bacterium]|jgi:crotonobetainyl-CoA:carnitine CoA-transferase CaiB-like acyl-CoA transferase|nr:CoA transferase [Acidimicrobiales bacterium]